MLKAILEPSVLLQRSFAYDDAPETQAHTNLQLGVNIALDMLTGYGQYTDAVSESMIGLHACFQQVSDLQGLQTLHAPGECRLFLKSCPAG